MLLKQILKILRENNLSIISLVLIPVLAFSYPKRPVVRTSISHPLDHMKCHGDKRRFISVDDRSFEMDLSQERSNDLLKVLPPRSLLFSAPSFRSGRVINTSNSAESRLPFLPSFLLPPSPLLVFLVLSLLYRYHWNVRSFTSISLASLHLMRLRVFQTHFEGNI